MVQAQCLILPLGVAVPPDLRRKAVLTAPNNMAPTDVNDRQRSPTVANGRVLKLRHKSVESGPKPLQPGQWTVSVSDNHWATFVGDTRSQRTHLLSFLRLCLVCLSPANVVTAELNNRGENGRCLSLLLFCPCGVERSTGEVWGRSLQVLEGSSRRVCLKCYFTVVSFMWGNYILS